MAKDRRNAKTAYTKAKAAELAVSKLVIITGKGHRVSKSIQLSADCGVRRVGWHYGETNDVTCEHCLDGSRYDDIIVPPTFPEEWYADGFELDGHRANDGDDVPILCYECGDVYPCSVILGTLPVLKVDEFERGTK